MSRSDHPAPIARCIASFRFAGRGIAFLIRSQPNARIHGAFSLAVVAAGIGFDISATEWCLLVLAMMAVWTCEAINTALERLADAAIPEQHPLVGEAKDVAAGAVLIAAIGSVAIGLFVLGPHVLAWWLDRVGSSWILSG